jgi:hypothetical protein
MSAAWLQSEMSDSACLQAQAQIPCAAARTSGRMGLPARSASLSHQSATSELLILHHDLRVGVACRIEGVSPGAITESLGGAGYKSRAGHSKTASKGSPRRLVFIGWTSCFCAPSPTGEQKEGIHPESGHRCQCYFSFLRSLFRPELGTLASADTKRCSPCGFRGFWILNERVARLLV